MLRVCVLLVFVCVLGVGSLRGRGLFCRDPDTGKLHAVNTTWPATSFCGNYHCKIRRKNLTGHVYAPLRQVNITNLKLIGENFTLIDIKDDNNINKDEVAKNIVNVDKKTEPDIIDGILNLKGETGTKLDDIVEDSNETEQDRYLSEKEIRSLTEMLHTVKKSDLDAIVEIYNLAQDIYKEIDKTSTDHVLEDIMHTAKTVENKFTRSDLLQKVIKQGHVSYWYEPLASGKVRAADLMRPDMSRTETMRNDMIPVIPAIPIDIEPPVDMVQVEPKPSINTKFSPTPSSEPYPANQMRRMTDTLLTGPLITHKDFGKLPYYYPMSNFQRMASYQHDPKKTITPSPRGAAPQQPYKAMTYKPMYTAGKYQKEIQKSILLPYPFSNIHHYNWSHPQNMYHRNHLFEDKESLSSNNPNPLSNPNTLSNLNIVSNPNTLSNLNVLNNPNTMSNLNTMNNPNSQNNLNALNNPNALKKLNTLNNPNTLSNLNTLHILNALKNANTQNNVNNPNKVNNRNALNSPLTLNIPNTLNILNALKNSNKLKTLNTLNNLNVLSNPNTLNILNVLKNPNALKTLNLNTQSNPITLKKHIQKPKNAVLMNPDLENFQDLEIKSTNNKEQIARSQNSDDRRKPDWQTDSLPKQILEEVRAHIQEKQRVFIHPFPLRKKVKLERVGKVHKMDEVKRTKRQVEGKKVTKEAQLEPELFEVFIGNTTCNSDYTVPGFFRYGNLSQPFPECCPQRIQTR